MAVGKAQRNSELSAELESGTKLDQCDKHKAVNVRLCIYTSEGFNLITVGCSGGNLAGERSR